ncbi:preprotein translocase subunit SecG [Flammeovirga kamogawensis]|nr:preprotein translocase subunit SecG [Flammeovirga kamogawensis]
MKSHKLYAFFVLLIVITLLGLSNLTSNSTTTDQKDNTETVQNNIERNEMN